MSFERNIIKRLLEGVEDVDHPTSDKDLNESSFEYGGHTYKCAFGHYTCDGEPISREDYMKAKEGDTSEPATPKETSEPDYSNYKSEDFSRDWDEMEEEMDQIAEILPDTPYEDRHDYRSTLNSFSAKLADMEGDVPDELWSRFEDMQDKISKIEAIEYDGPEEDPYTSRGLSRRDFD